MLSQFEMDKLKEGKVNKALKSLNGKIREFLKDYDEDENGEVDVEELVTRKDKFAEDLNKNDNKVQKIIDSIKELEKAIIEYRKLFIQKYQQSIQLIKQMTLKKY